MGVPIKYFKTCISCGKEFETYHYKQNCCSDECRSKLRQSVYNENKDKYEKKKTKPKETIEEIVRKAMKAGMTYGQYVQQQEISLKKL